MLVLCRLLRHDMVAELCEAAIRFQEKGGTASVLPGGAFSGNAQLPGAANDLALFVYGNVEVKNLVAAKFGPGIQFEVLQTPLLCVVLHISGTRCLQYVAMVAAS